jgi:hypothetical protein
MAKQSSTPAQNLLDSVRPAESDGPLRSAVLSTYGLSLDQPNLFEYDFLPTLLGLGDIRELLIVFDKGFPTLDGGGGLKPARKGAGNRSSSRWK